MKKVLTLALSGITVFTLAGCFGGDSNNNGNNGNGNDDDVIVKDNLDNEIVENPNFERFYHVESSDCKSIDLKDAVKIYDRETGEAVTVTNDMVSWTDGAPNCGGSATEGEYKFDVKIMDGELLDAQYNGSVQVRNLYTTNDTELKFISGEEREQYVAAAENFLIESGAGGVPLYSNGSYRIYNERFTPANEEYQVIMGYAEGFGEFADTDQEYAGKKGDTSIFANERTIRDGAITMRYWSSSSVAISTLNQWNYTSSTENTLLSRMYDRLYTPVQGENGIGVAYVPSMASENPVAIGDGKNTEANGEESATEFIVPLSKDLTFHDGTSITATDFYETYLLAFQQDWTRISTLTAADFGIKGAEDFKNLEDSQKTEEKWEDSVGFEALNETQCNEALAGTGETAEATCLKYTFEGSQTEWSLRYNLGVSALSPIHPTYRAENKVADYGTYTATSFETIGSGAFELEVLQENSEYHLVRADRANLSYNKELVDRYNYNEYNQILVKDSLAAFEHFDDDKLDYTTIPGTLYEDNKNREKIRQVPGSVVWRLGVNGLGTNENQKEFATSDEMESLGRKIDQDYDPEVILSNTYIKNAMYLAIDRTSLAENELATSETSGHIFGRAYTADPQGTAQEYRKTEAGLSVGDSMGTNTSAAGYNPTAATQYFEAGIKQLIEAGTIERGDTFEIDFRMFAASTTVNTITDHVKRQFEAYLKSETYDVDVEVVVRNAQGTESVYDDYAAASFDVGFMAISGSSLAPEAFLDVFTDSYDSSFNYNYGADTSSPEIEIELKSGEKVYVSYNALQKLLNGNASVENGRLV